MDLSLTTEEVDVLRLSISGMKSGEIATFIGMSTHMVDAHLLSIFRKLNSCVGISSRDRRHCLRAC